MPAVDDAPPVEPAIGVPPIHGRKGLGHEKLEKLAKRVSYTGNPEHKETPGDFELTPPVQPRPDKSKGDWIGILDRACGFDCPVEVRMAQRHPLHPTRPSSRRVILLDKACHRDIVRPL